jgi:transglutaminase-like putative cysteine protease
MLVAFPASAGGPLVHEYIAPQPAEDLLLEATALGSHVKAALDTPAGVVTAPDVRRGPAPNETAYGGASTPSSSDASYDIDRMTTEPGILGYHDPFIPSIAPFKRLYAYDSVDESLTLSVHRTALERLEVGGDPRAGEDQFYGDIVVDLASAVPVRIPTVGPGARVLAASIHPGVPFELLHDGADNWFIRSSVRRRARLALQLAIDRRAFGGAFAATSYAALAPALPPMPRVAEQAAARVLQAVGVSQATRPADAVSALVHYFRSFAPSSEFPTARGGSALYQELSLSQKGVCRHRAYSFVVTALALGVPARMVRNEAHAWVEVWDGELWHRIDLGGAAAGLQVSRAADAPQYRPPADSYEWPAGSQSGTQAADGAIGEGSPAAPRNLEVRSASRAAQPPPTRPRPEPSSTDPPPVYGPAELTVRVKDKKVRRGETFRVSGNVQAQGHECANVRVDVALRDATGLNTTIQSLAADERGQFDSAVTVPFDLRVGDYEVLVATPGTAKCGAGSSR